MKKFYFRCEIVIPGAPCDIFDPNCTFGAEADTEGEARRLVEKVVREENRSLRAARIKICEKVYELSEQATRALHTGTLPGYFDPSLNKALTESAA